MAYSSFDFTESMDRVGIDLSSIERVIAAWGSLPEYFAEWEGGFLLAMRDGRTVYVTGWCDTSGWGCQDSADMYEYPSAELDRTQLPGVSGPDSKLGVTVWDEDPADLNRLLVEAGARA